MSKTAIIEEAACVYCTMAEKDTSIKDAFAAGARWAYAFWRRSLSCERDIVSEMFWEQQQLRAIDVVRHISPDLRAKIDEKFNKTDKEPTAVSLVPNKV